MLDLQQAFDAVDHSILLMKLKALGFKGAALNWVRSYVKSRKQMVDVNGVLSEPKPLFFGVPQGSILGPLFFLLYVNDNEAACSLYLFQSLIIL